MTKLKRLLAIHGLGGTFQLFVAKVIGAVLYFTPARRRARLAVRAQDFKFDRQWGVDTRGMLIPGENDVVGFSWVHGSRYQGVCADSLQQTLRDLKIEYEHFTFVDFGSGKGRAVMTAALFPFQKIIGVEYSRPLHEVAVRNLSIFPETAKQCPDIELVCADAAGFPIPGGPLVIFLYNPFSAAIMSQLVQNVEASLQCDRRRIVVLYFIAACADVWNNCPAFPTSQGDKALTIYDSMFEDELVSAAAA